MEKKTVLPITISENTLKKLEQLIVEQEENIIGIRFFIMGGGCGGVQFGLDFETQVNEDDFVVSSHFSFDDNRSLDFIFDAVSWHYYTGAIINFDENSGRFNINNPNIQTRCAGCGGH